MSDISAVPPQTKERGMHITILFVVSPFRIHHYNDVILGAIASQITSLTIIVYSTVYSDANQRKHQSSASLAFMRGIHRGPVNSPHKWPVTRKMFPFDDVIMREIKFFLPLSIFLSKVILHGKPSVIQHHTGNFVGQLCCLKNIKAKAVQELCAISLTNSMGFKLCLEGSIKVTS